MNEWWISGKTVGSPSRERRGTGTERFVGCESNPRSLRRLIKAYGMRRRVHASEPLFLPGDDTRYWYFLEVGCLLVSAPGAERRGSLAVLGAGTFFSFGGGGRHELVCKAVEASTVICLDRRQVESLARHDHALQKLLRDAAGWELELTLRRASERAVRSRAKMTERRPRRVHDNPYRVLDFRGEQAVPK
jgi:CRP-like cAMP-binding protein